MKPRKSIYGKWLDFKECLRFTYRSYQRRYQLDHWIVNELKSIFWTSVFGFEFLAMYTNPSERSSTIFSETPYSITYQIQYVHDQKVYLLLHTVSKEGGERFLRASGLKPNESIETDISSYIHSLLGPQEDFHLQLYTPHFLGYEKITLWFLNSDTFEEESSTFLARDILSL